MSVYVAAGLAFVLVPVSSVGLTVAIASAAGESIGDLSMQLVIPVALFASVSGGILASRVEQPATRHGWWALLSAGIAVVFFGLILGIAT